MFAVAGQQDKACSRVRRHVRLVSVRLRRGRGTTCRHRHVESWRRRYPEENRNYAVGYDESTAESSSAVESKDTVARALVVGGGPAGLATAIMLAQKGWKVRVVEKRDAPPPPSDASYTSNPDRSYNLGVSARGQTVLDRLGVLENVLKFASFNYGRQTWDENGNTKLQLRKAESYQAICIQRDRLTGVLLEAARTYSSIEIEHNVEVSSITWNSSGPQVSLGEEEKVFPDLLVGADGFNSKVAKALESEGVSPIKVKTFEDKNTRVYKTVPLDYDLDKSCDFRRDLNFSVLSQNGAEVTLEVLPTAEGKGVGVCLYKPGNKAVELAASAEKAKELFVENFPQFSTVIPDSAFGAFASQRDQRLPVFQVALNSLVGPKTVCIGDAIHTVKPYFGLGVNSAFEDVGAFANALEGVEPGNLASEDLEKSLDSYSSQHKENCAALVRMSRSFDGGFLTFVLPIILDSIFSKIFPKLFGPISIRMLQQHELPFGKASFIKRRDRALQVAILSAVLYAIVRLFRWTIGKLIAS